MKIEDKIRDWQARLRTLVAIDYASQYARQKYKMMDEAGAEYMHGELSRLVDEMKEFSEELRGHT